MVDLRRKVLLKVTVGVAAAALAVVLVLAVTALRSAGRDRALHALFEGPEQFILVADTPNVPTVKYDYDRWLAESDNVSWEREALRPAKPDDPYEYVDGAERDAFETMLYHSRALDGTTRASRKARLQSPTVYREKRLPRDLTLTYPVDNALFPPNLCSPFVEWSDARNNLWEVTLSVPGTDFERKFLSRTCRRRIPDDAWDAVKSLAVDRHAELTVRGVEVSDDDRKLRDTVHVSATVRLSVSRDPADSAVVYRLVDPPFARYKTPDIYVRDLREKEPRVFLRSRREYCFNCHTFSRKSGTAGKLVFQVRYMGKKKFDVPVYFAVYDIARHEGVRTSLPWKIQMTTFMAWSPDETKMALSANQNIATLPPVVYETQQAGMPTSDLAVYDTVNQTASLLPGADHPDRIEIYPRWTPDGQQIVYCRSPAGVHPALMKLQLCVIDYNDGRGEVEGRPIVPARDLDKSNYYPRFSPDGRWLSFVRSDGGSMIKSSSDIYLLAWKDRDREDVKAMRLDSNAPWAADSWYSWSSNSRWIVFASKRDDGVFARLYLTHVDEHGKASVPVRVPLTDPPMMSFNVPEFVASVPPIEERELYEQVRVDREVKAIRPGAGG
ncbi:MAG TPA: hypothetical protein VMY39_09955, partial [Planctomycetota bacterium]|nr:hypothetical protein [Planctomycetota bacterium]